MNNKKQEIPKLKMVLCGDQIITVGAETNTSYLGYDAITEDLVSVSKAESIPMPDLITRLLKDEPARLKLAQTLCGHNVRETSKVLGMSQRQLFRIRAKHKMLEV